MKLRFENLPTSLRNQSEPLARCLEAMNRVHPIHQVYLFGSHARGEARADSDVDLCVVAEGAGGQIETGNRYYSSLWDVWPRPALTLIPTTPQCLKEKMAIGDHFFGTVMKEGVLVATQD